MLKSVNLEIQILFALDLLHDNLVFILFNDFWGKNSINYEMRNLVTNFKLFGNFFPLLKKERVSLKEVPLFSEIFKEFSALGIE